MRREDVPPGMHRAIPTNVTDTPHEGSYSSQCLICQAVVTGIAGQPLTANNGAALRFGSLVRIEPGYLPEGYPAWVTITGIRVNTHTGEVWLTAFALGHLVLRAENIAEAHNGIEVPA